MLSLSQLRTNLFPLFRVLSKTGTTMEVGFNNKVYELSIRYLPDRNVEYRRLKRGRSAVMPHSIDVGTCKACGEAMIQGVCMNKKCNNSKPSI